MAELNRRTTQVNAIRAILAFVRGNDFNVVTLERVEILSRNLNRHHDTFLRVHDVLIGANIPAVEFNAHEQVRAAIENEVLEAEEALARKRQQLQQANPPPIVPPPPARPQVIQIEGINRLLAQKIEHVWGEFDGTIWKWASFKDLFRTSVHDNEHLSGAQ